MCENCARDNAVELQGTEPEPAQAACSCPPSRLERFAEPCVLLSLAREAAHGYQLIEKLAGFGLEELAPDPTVVYRTLRRMERDGLVTSKWLTDGPGPARRLYSLTPEGEELLHAWVITIRKNRNALERFLDAYARQFGKAPARAR